jgi:hypothetical protein
LGIFLKVWISMRTIVAAAVLVSMSVPVLAQTQPTRPSTYPTFPTMHLAWATAPLDPCYGQRRGYRSSSFNPTSPCYTGTPYLNYSAIEPNEFSNQTNPVALPGSASLDAAQAKLRIEAKGYLDVSDLEKDSRGIWQGKATMKDGRPVDVTVDLEGNIYSEWRNGLYIRVRPSPSK